MGLLVNKRTSDKSASIFSALLYANPKLPTAPAFDTAATNIGGVIPPAIGAWIIGSWFLINAKKLIQDLWN
jgi:hypothetical protein